MKNMKKMNMEELSGKGNEFEVANNIENPMIEMDEDMGGDFE